VGIDLGVTHLATLSNGEMIEHPRYSRQAKKVLEKRQQALSRKKRGSHRRNKARQAVAEAHRKIARQRKDFHHKQSREMVKRYQVIVFEDIETSNLSRKPKPKQDENGKYLPTGASAKGGLNKSILDAGWGSFVQLCSVKAAWAGRALIKGDPKSTSQVCSGPGQVRKKDLSERWHSCDCGTELDRDINAAINILERGRRQRGATCVEAPCLEAGEHFTEREHIRATITYMDTHTCQSRRANSMHLAHPDISFALFSLAPPVALFSLLEREHAQRVPGLCTQAPRVFEEARQAPFARKILVLVRCRFVPRHSFCDDERGRCGSVLHQQHHRGGDGLFPGLLNVRLYQRRKGDIWLTEQTIQSSPLFPGLHQGGQRTQGILRQLAGRFYRASRATHIMQLDTPKGSLGPALGVRHVLRSHLLFYHFVKSG
jgi:Probable transposase/Putative transposase DNA-binding domain